jgi:hypothetical protein
MTHDRSTARPPAQDLDLIVYDGREVVGWIRRYSNTFLAFNAGGKLLGRFRTRHEALRALPVRARRAAP